MNDMKKGLIFVLFALVSIVSYSQISWNAKVGMNMSNFTGDMDTCLLYTSKTSQRSSHTQNKQESDIAYS